MIDALRVLACAALLGCAHVAVAPTANDMACRRAIRAFATFEPTRIVPLPGTCTLADAAAVLHREHGAPAGGTPAREAFDGSDDPDLLRIFRFVARRHDIEVWTLRRTIVAIDLLRVLPEPYVRALGAPAQVEEAVWFARGVGVRGDRIRLFPPTSRRDYRDYEREPDEDEDDDLGVD